VKPRDRRQFAAVVRAVIPADRRAAITQVLARLGRWRERRLNLDHVRMAPIHVLAAAATDARMQGEQLIIQLMHGRLILEPGADWDAQMGDLRDLAILFRRVRLDWHGRTTSLTLEGRPDPAGVVIARAPAGDVVITDAGAHERTPDGVMRPFNGAGLEMPLGAFILDRLARALAWHPPVPDSPALAALQREATDDAWAIYTDWLLARDQARPDSPTQSASPLLATWLACPRADGMRWGLSWRQGHLIEARLSATQGPEMLGLLSAVLDGPECVALRTLTIQAEMVQPAVIDRIAVQARPALRHLRWSSTWQTYPACTVQPLLDACPHLRTLALPECQIDGPLRSDSLKALAFSGWRAPESGSDWRLPAVEHLDVGGRVPLTWLTRRDALPRLRRLVLREQSIQHISELQPIIDRVEHLCLFQCSYLSGQVRPALRRALGDRLSFEIDSEAFWHV
jgi:hypothetical protein